MLDRLDVRVASVGDPDAMSALASASRWPFDLIVSNPPYIPTAEWRELQPEVMHTMTTTRSPAGAVLLLSGGARQVLEWEDRGALDGGLDGLDITRQILSAALPARRPPLLADGGSIWLELDDGQPDQLRQLEGNSGPGYFAALCSWRLGGCACEHNCVECSCKTDGHFRVSSRQWCLVGHRSARSDRGGGPQPSHRDHGNASRFRRVGAILRAQAQRCSSSSMTPKNQKYHSAAAFVVTTSPSRPPPLLRPLPRLAQPPLVLPLQ